MELSPDTHILWQYGFIKLNYTIIFTWAVMAFMIISSWLISRSLSIKPPIGRWQHVLESVVVALRGSVRDIVEDDPKPYLPYIGTLFLFIAIANIFTIFPLYHTPMSSLSTTGALAVCTFFSVPFFGIQKKGLRHFLAHYVQPSWILLPFNIIEEFSRTLALAVRLFGNMMSGHLVVAVLISLVPLFIPVLMQAFDLLIGIVQAYIFSVLTAVYIAAGVRVQYDRGEAI